MSGSGNDFILIDNRDGILKDFNLNHFARKICRRKLSVGADGLILIEISDKADFRWQFFNSDGSEAEMCGNGGRCVARLAYLLGIAPETMKFETRAGIINAKVNGNNVKVELPPPVSINPDIKLTLESETFNLHSITTGVPHVVIFCDSLENLDISNIGRKIRYHPLFQPAGTNVNWVKIRDLNLLEIRTYERGVEEETLACGTGAVASALIASVKDMVSSPVRVKTKGGEILTVSFIKKGTIFENISLTGEVKIIYKGELLKEAYDEEEEPLSG